MGCQDLLDECRARAGQAYDEYRVGCRYAASPVTRKELRRADLDLQAGVELDHLRPVVTLSPLEPIAAGVIVERLLVLFPVLQRFAQGEAQVVAIHRGCRCRRLRG